MATVERWSQALLWRLPNSFLYGLLERATLLFDGFVLWRRNAKPTPCGSLGGLARFVNKVLRALSLQAFAPLLLGLLVALRASVW